MSTSGGGADPLLELLSTNTSLVQKVADLTAELDLMTDVKVGAEQETLRLRNIINATPDERAKRLSEAEARVRYLEAINEGVKHILSAENATSGGRRVMRTMEKLSQSLLRWLGSIDDFGLTDEDIRGLRHLVAFEIARRIEVADIDLPLYKSDSEVIEASLDHLLEELEQATKAGAKARTMTAREREKRYEDFIRAKGWLKEGEQLAVRRPKDATPGTDEDG